MDNLEIKRRATALNSILIKYETDLGVLEKELLKAVEDYHEALKQEKLKELRESIKI